MKLRPSSLKSGFLGSEVKNLPVKQEIQKSRVESLGQEDPLKEDSATQSSILAWRIPGQRSLAGYRPWGHRESDMTETPERTHAF